MVFGCEFFQGQKAVAVLTHEQISARVAMIRAAGFNAFRDAHHPHNLRYYSHWDQAGILCWTQMGSKIWFDTPDFRANFKQLVREWVRERRNHPCIMLWGLQNESALPADFAAELVALIRELDPTSSVQRLVTTCNGGKGSDWNVPQEWSGTYGGNFHDYDLGRLQMVGEYGAWRAFGVHTEIKYRGDENDGSESWACQAMETKIRLGESVRDHAIGHFHWVFNSFSNPGRTADNYEGPGNARIGSVNNKGLVTSWGQPSDLYYLYRANYANVLHSPMVYIVSHTWPQRWAIPCQRDVTVYSNCPQVELFNGIGTYSLGLKDNPGRGHHFVWEGVLPRTDLLHAVGYRNGQIAAEDLIQLDGLPRDERLLQWIGEHRSVSPPHEHVLYRISCGSAVEIVDGWGRVWSEDHPWNDSVEAGWESWGNNFSTVPDGIASFGMTMIPVRDTAHQELYRHYRYGRQQLRYHFRTGPGLFRVTLHFVEPWFGVGEGVDCARWRMFDIAFNGKVVERDLDIFTQAGGHHRALERSFLVGNDREILTLHFPRVSVNQAVISAVEISLGE